jgi:hypothetical protein
MLAIIVVATGSVAMMQFMYASSVSAITANEITTAEMLVDSIREATASLPIVDPESDATSFGREPGETLSTFDDVDDFAGQSFSPPIDATRTTIDALSDYNQKVDVYPIAWDDPGGNTDGSDIAAGTYTGALRVVVTVGRRHADQAERVVLSSSFLRIEP